MAIFGWFDFCSALGMWAVHMLGNIGNYLSKNTKLKIEKREFYKSLRERIKQLRMEHLFEEPCPFYERIWMMKNRIFS